MADISTADLLAAVPQREPFRFIDEILAVDDDRISAAYRFRPDAEFYRGHFPGNPITPGVLLIETMAQAGVVAHGIYLLARASHGGSPPSMLALFAEASVDFVGVVRPGERVLVEGRKIYFRHRKLRSAVEMRRENGEVVCRGTLAGMALAQ